MITTNDIERFLTKLKDINRRLPEFNLGGDIEKIEKLLKEIEKEPTVAVHIAIIKSPKITEEK